MPDAKSLIFIKKSLQRVCMVIIQSAVRQLFGYKYRALPIQILLNLIAARKNPWLPCQNRREQFGQRSHYLEWEINWISFLFEPDSTSSCSKSDHCQNGQLTEGRMINTRRSLARGEHLFYRYRRTNDDFIGCGKKTTHGETNNMQMIANVLSEEINVQQQRRIHSRAIVSN